MARDSSRSPPVGPYVELPAPGAPGLSSSLRHPQWACARPSRVDHPGEEAVGFSRVPEPLAVDQRALPVVPAADIVLIDAEVLGNDHRAHLVQNVVPREGTQMSTGTVPPDHPHLVELGKASSCSLDAGAVELEQLIDGRTRCS